MEGALIFDVSNIEIYDCRGVLVVFTQNYFPLLLSSEVETVQVHDLGPNRNEILDELFPGIRAAVYFRQGTQLGV